MQPFVSGVVHAVHQILCTRQPQRQPPKWDTHMLWLFHTTNSQRSVVVYSSSTMQLATLLWTSLRAGFLRQIPFWRCRHALTLIYKALAPRYNFISLFHFVADHYLFTVARTYLSLSLHALYLRCLIQRGSNELCPSRAPGL